VSFYMHAYSRNIFPLWLWIVSWHSKHEYLWFSFSLNNKEYTVNYNFIFYTFGCCFAFLCFKGFLSSIVITQYKERTKQKKRVWSRTLEINTFSKKIGFRVDHAWRHVNQMYPTCIKGQPPYVEILSFWNTYLQIGYTCCRSCGK
jgi:hypothetical protein